MKIVHNILKFPVCEIRSLSFSPVSYTRLQLSHNVKLWIRHGYYPSLSWSLWKYSDPRTILPRSALLWSHGADRDESDVEGSTRRQWIRVSLAPKSHTLKAKWNKCCSNLKDFKVKIKNGCTVRSFAGSVHPQFVVYLSWKKRLKMSTLMLFPCVKFK